MTVSLDTLLEGSPSYGVLDARDGVVLYARQGHEAAFNAIAAAAMEAAGVEFSVIPLGDDEHQCDRLFIVPLGDESAATS